MIQTSQKTKRGKTSWALAERKHKEKKLIDRERDRGQPKSRTLAFSVKDSRLVAPNSFSRRYDAPQESQTTKRALPFKDICLRAALAGGIAGAFVNGALHPLDTVKTLRQTDPTRFKGTLKTLQDIVSHEGVVGLYRGVVPAVVGAFPSSALYFGTYEAVKGCTLQRIPRDRFRQLSAFSHMFSAACGNTASSIIFVPKEVIKQRMQQQAGEWAAAGAAGAAASTSAAVRGQGGVTGLQLVTSGTRFRQVLVETVRDRGIAGLYRGYWSTLVRNIPTTALSFCIYEQLKLAVLTRKREHNASSTGGSATQLPLSPFEHIAMGAVAGALSSGITTPLDVIKTRFATQNLAPNTTIIQALNDVIAQHGVRKGLFAGLKPRMLWAALFSAIGFSSYEFMSRTLSPLFDPRLPLGSPVRPDTDFD